MDTNFNNTNVTTNSEKKIEYAGFWIRVGATFLDSVVLIPFGIFYLYNILVLKNLELHILSLMLQMVYKPFLEYKYGATVGKMWLKLKVVSEDYGPITFNQALMRYLPWFVNNLVGIYAAVNLFHSPGFGEVTSIFQLPNLQVEQNENFLNTLGSMFLFVSCLLVAFSLKKQGLHDTMAKTYCIQE